MGLDKRDSEGFRLRPDGRRLSITIDYTESDTPKTPTLELVKEYWEAVGVQTQLNYMTNTLVAERATANLIQVGIHHADRSTDPLIFTEPFWYAPVQVGWEQTTWPLYAQWYNTGGAAGEEPPEHVKELIDIFNAMQRTTDEDERCPAAPATAAAAGGKLVDAGDRGQRALCHRRPKRGAQCPRDRLVGLGRLLRLSVPSRTVLPRSLIVLGP